MRLLPTLILCLGAVLPAFAALNLEGVPACGVQCLLTAVTESTCAPTNTTCICTNAQLLGQITECVSGSCSIRDQLSTKKFSSETCNVVGEDRTALVRNLAIIFGVLGIVAFALRCFARLVGSQSWGMDDWVMTLVMFFMIPLAAISIPLSHHGLGLDMWFVPFDDVNEILHLYFFDELLYITALALTKVSILFFYLKVFPKRSFRICTWVLIGGNLAYALAYDLLLIFQCNPIQDAWLGWDGESGSQCISINIIGWSAAAINIFLDLAVIVLPLPELFQLSMSIKKKVQIVAMFAVGFFITVVSIVRLHSLIQFGTTSNLTQDYVEVGYWSTIEVPVGVICACMPAIRSLFSLVFPKVFGTTRVGKSNYNYGSSFGPSSVPVHASSNNHHHSSNNNNNNNNNNKINVKQEWTVLSDPVDNHDPYPMRSNSEVELVKMDTAITNEDGPTRKMTLKREKGSWRGRAKDEEDGTYYAR